jgi:hypothetical protein
MATTGIAQNKIKRFETASDLAGARAGVPGWGCRLGKGAKKKKGGWGKKKFFGYPEPQDRMRINLLLSCTRVVHLPLIFARLGSRRSVRQHKVKPSGLTPFFQRSPKICGLQRSSMVDHWYRRWATRNRVVSELVVGDRRFTLSLFAFTG